MKNFLFALLILLQSCQTVSNKIDKTTSKEEMKLNNFLSKSEENLKIEMGTPNEIKKKIGSNNRFYIYYSKRLSIKCERIFEINQRNVVVGFSSKNCF
tara:strand:+ start:3194 stop:3487 length:294 start_codon:yes stop_codon:yes gene_type:complete